MEGENLQPKPSQLGSGKIIVERLDEKIEVEIREVLRVRPKDFDALKNSFEEWANMWN